LTYWDLKLLFDCFRAFTNPTVSAILCYVFRLSRPFRYCYHDVSWTAWTIL